MSLKLQTMVENAQTASFTDQDKVRKIAKRVKRAVDKRTLYLLEGLVANAVDAMFEEMHGMEKEESLRRQFNVTRSLKIQYNLFLDEYETLNNLSWTNLIKKKNKRSVPEPDPQINQILKAYSIRSFSRHKFLLAEIRVRFNILVQRDLQYHPLLPDNFFICFWHATDKLGLKFEERKLLLPLFNRFVMERFGRILAAANQSLIDQGVREVKDEHQPPIPTLHQTSSHHPIS